MNDCLVPRSGTILADGDEIRVGNRFYDENDMNRTSRNGSPRISISSDLVYRLYLPRLYQPLSARRCIPTLRVWRRPGRRRVRRCSACAAQDDGGMGRSEDHQTQRVSAAPGGDRPGPRAAGGHRAGAPAPSVHREGGGAFYVRWG